MKRIVCGYDGSDNAMKAARIAAELAKEGGGALTLLYVVEPPGPPVGAGITMSDYVEPQKKAARIAVAEAADDVSGVGIDVKYEVRSGRPAVELTNFATDNNADLIVVGSHGRGAAQRLLLGSVSDRVAHLANIPVLIVR